MSYINFLERARTKHMLFSAMLELTYRCNWDCYFCYNDRALQGKPMSFEDYQQLLEGLAGMGTMHLTLTGGEPLVHPDFFRIGAKARELDFLVRVKTNAHALRGKVLERFVKEVDPYSIDVSLHGATAEIHDRQTQTPGSFKRLIENLPVLRDRGLRIKINATLTRWNEHQIDDMFALADKLEIPISLQAEVTPRDDGDMTPLSIAPAPAAIAYLMDVRKARAQAYMDANPSKADDPPPASSHHSDQYCGSGSSSITVDPYGNVLPCVQLRRSVGNLHELSIRDIWEGSTALEEVRASNRAAKRMVDAERAAGRPVQNFCPGSAQMQAGSPIKFYPAATLNQLLLQRKNS